MQAGLWRAADVRALRVSVGGIALWASTSGSGPIGPQLRGHMSAETRCSARTTARRA